MTRGTAGAGAATAEAAPPAPPVIPPARIGGVAEGDALTAALAATMGR
ncbi:hypothetical protein ABZ318_34575 [Streptomyces sp. NPDC006197]